MLAIFLSALANVIGLGVIVPLLPFFALQHGADPAEAAWLFAVFSLAQFVTAPLWGRLSDRIGRKPVIVISLAGSAATYVWLAFADDLAGIYAARIAAGVMNGWLATSQAYIADVTEPEGRAKGMGMLGAAFGIGFVIGPALGGWLVGSGDLDYRLPMLIAAAGSGAALIVALAMLREPARHRAHQETVRLAFLPSLLAVPLLGTLVALYFSLFFVFSGMESTLALWCKRVMAMGPREVGYYLAFAGICGVIVQGGLVGRLVPLVGEARVVLIGYLAVAAGLALLPFVPAPPWLIPAIGLLAVGFGFANPSLQSLISRAAPATMRGGTMGVAQSANSLGRILGPLWAGFAFASIGIAWPFLSGALLLIPVVAVTVVVARQVSRATPG